jgi:hypothetical protein
LKIQDGFKGERKINDGEQGSNEDDPEVDDEQAALEKSLSEILKERK